MGLTRVSGPVEMGTREIIDWDAAKVAKFGTVPLMLSHSLCSHPLFSEDAIARLLENPNRANYYVNTMDTAGHNRASRREGELKGLSGLEVLDAVRRGVIWILLLKPEKADRRYGELLETIYAEMHRTVPGFRTDFRKMTLLISSPKVQVHYHCDIPGQTLWQVRGEKRVYVYPNRAPFLDQEALERIALGEAHEFALPYNSDFDKEATIFDLKPGQMLHWPLNAPHRIVNGDCVNVSFTTEHFTAANRRSFYVNYANGVLRKQFGRKALSQQTSGPGYWAKLGVAAGYKYARGRTGKTLHIDFAVDPSAERCVRTIPAYELRV
jgi:hypothetical protein